MRFTFHRLLALGFLLFGTAARAQSIALTNGAILDQAPCPAYSPPAYAEYVESVKAAYTSEQEAAKREGLVMQTPLAYATRDEFEQRKAASGGVSCTRLVYASD